MTCKLLRTTACVGLAVVALHLVGGCASSQNKGPTEAQRQFAAGQEQAFAMLQQSGILVVRVVGPFEIPVVEWHDGMTLAEVILAAGYLEPHDPTQLLIQRGPTSLTIHPDLLLRGEDVPVEGGDVIHVLP